MTRSPVGSARSPAKSLLRAFLIIHLFFPITWLWSQVSAGQPDQRDWFYLRLAGERVLQEDWTSIYSSIDDGFLWRYPPFALYFAALLAMASPGTAYWLLVLIAIGALATTLFLMRDAVHPPDFPLIVLAVATSAAFTSVLVTGQNSPLIALTIAAGLWGLLRGNATLPFVFFGLLAIKPNWLPVFGLYALIRRHIRGFTIMVTIGLGVLLAGLPLGVTGDFLDASFRNSELLGDFPAYKLITMRGFLGAFTDSTTLWIVVLVALGACGISIWRPGSRAPIQRQLGVVVLITIAANPYVAFYDGLILMIPAIIWWASRDTYASSWARRAIGAIIAFIWIWDQAVFFYAGVARSLDLIASGTPGFSPVGPALAAWILIETLDVLVGHRKSRLTVPAN
jgi:hypothetical protein